METSIELATNAELTEEKDRLQKEFDTTKEEFYQIYQKLTDISNKFHNIEEVLNKRTGKS